ncbi:MAG: response regulator transcription factor [Acidobacteria bacterium]|nr:response regulator transcription factor [Acidobacteriota bacterium]
MIAAPKKILVAEGNEIIVVLIAHLLTRNSYVVHTTVDTQEAERMLLQEPYDAALIDLANGGAEMIRRVSDRLPKLMARVIALTAKPEDAVHLQGVCAVVKKPFVTDQLLDTVRECTHGHGPQR